MSYFAVHYSYAPAPDELDALRPEHRRFLNSLTDGPLVASGPYVDAAAPSALLILRAESAGAVEEILNEDPFWVAGLISERLVNQWNPVIGILTD